MGEILGEKKMTQIATVDTQPAVLTPADHKTRIDQIQSVTRKIMKKGIHYLTIPGTDKPMLAKSGAEVLLATFRIAVIEIMTDDLSELDMVRYRIRITGAVDGEPVGVGIGECSSAEEKYAWRKAVCQEEFEDTPENRRRRKWAKGRNGAYSVDQVKTNPYDQANTILKMAKKRALVDLALTSVAASDLFSQDLEDRKSGPKGGSSRPSAIQTKVLTAVNTMGLQDSDVQDVASKLGLGPSSGWTMAEADTVIDELEKLKMK
jgi:hypothetical protein